MNELAYLGIAIVLSSLGSIVLVIRHRRPMSVGSGVDDFSRRLRALEHRSHHGGRRPA